jgi:hypothetical protein
LSDVKTFSISKYFLENIIKNVFRRIFFVRESGSGRVMPAEEGIIFGMYMFAIGEERCGRKMFYG